MQLAACVLGDKAAFLVDAAQALRRGDAFESAGAIPEKIVFRPTVADRQIGLVRPLLQALHEGGKNAVEQSGGIGLRADFAVACGFVARVDIDADADNGAQRFAARESVNENAAEFAAIEKKVVRPFEADMRSLRIESFGYRERDGLRQSLMQCGVSAQVDGKAHVKVAGRRLPDAPALADAGALFAGNAKQGQGRARMVEEIALGGVQFGEKVGVAGKVLHSFILGRVGKLARFY